MLLDSVSQTDKRYLFATNALKFLISGKDMWTYQKNL